MNRNVFIKLIKTLVFPLTPVVLLFCLTILVTLYTLIITCFINPEFALVSAVIVAISIPVLILYILDRIIVKRIPYNFIIVGEFFLGLVFVLMYFHQNNTNEIKIKTANTYVLIIADSKANAINDFSQFDRIGLFKRRLEVSNQTIYIDSTFYKEKTLKIAYPDDWINYESFHESYKKNGRTINYEICFKNYHPNNRFVKDSIVKTHFSSN